jgi:uncharacterized membrane protein
MSVEQVSIEINAPLDVTWRAVTDVESWPKWTTSVSSVERLDAGPLRVGSTTRIKQPAMARIVWQVTSLQAGREFTWVGRSPGALTIAQHLLGTAPDGAARLTLTVEHRGPLAGLVRRLTRKRTRRYLNLEANGLKASSEAAVTAA